jgi:hypothetical protein
MAAEKAFRVTIEGTDATGMTWATDVRVSGIPFPQALDRALSESFQQLTQGKAVYGKPGVGCRGPYEIAKLTLVAEAP